MSHRTSVLEALAHRQPARLPVDFGGTGVTGIHVSCVAALREYFGLSQQMVTALDPGSLVGVIDEDLKQCLGISTEGVYKRMTRFGFPHEDFKPWRMPDGLEILVPGRFNVTHDANGDILMHPGGDTSLPASSRIPVNGYFFDAIIRQPPIEEDKLDPADNLEEYGPISDEELDHLERTARAARATGRAVTGNFGGTSFGDIAHVPGVGLAYPKGIRDVEEWYISTRSRRPYVHAVFAGMCEIALANLERIAARCGDCIDVINVCGTDFGTQTSSFCSVATFRELWFPYYRQVNGWVHRNTKWKTFKHSCGAVERFIPSFIECGFDILNPVQCSAAGMDAGTLKQRYGSDLVFWGGGVDTQQVLPFGTPAEVREQVLRRCETFHRDGGFVFAAVHNIQAGTPVENIVAMINAIQEFQS